MLMVIVMVIVVIVVVIAIVIVIVIVNFLHIAPLSKTVCLFFLVLPFNF